MALYCPACERLQYHEFSFFDISSSPRPFHCSCGFTQGHIVKKKKRYEVRLLSPAGVQVRLLYSFREFWAAPLLTFYTADEDEALGYLGNPQDVDEAVAAWNNDFVEPGDFDEPEIMSAILGYLQKLASSNKIACECNHPSVGIDVYPDKVELVCSSCSSGIVIGATSAKDVQKLAQLTEIVMQPASYTWLGEAKTLNKEEF
ncbi:MAG: hypothetical protein GX208_02995 [Firmicutes bacterium]|nr:hypothetical protein [Bacillota bacterium]